MIQSGSGLDVSSLPVVGWPIRCPVDARWLSANEATCPDCGSSTAALIALNAMAAQMLARARSSESQRVAIQLVDDASELVTSTEAFELEAAAVLENIGRPDLAALRIESATRVAPQREDLRNKLGELLRTPVRSEVAGPRRRPIWLAVGALALVVAGASAGAWMASSGDALTGLGTGVSPSTAPTPSSPPPSPSGEAPTPPAAPTPSGGPSPSPASAAGAIRVALDADPVFATLLMSIEDVGIWIRIAGIAPDIETVGAIRDLAVAAAPGIPIDTDGLSTPPEPMYQFVQPGDTLWAIAARAYGHPYRWREIARANPDIDPRRLEIGARVLVPPIR